MFNAQVPSYQQKPRKKHFSKCFENVFLQILHVFRHSAATRTQYKTKHKKTHTHNANRKKYQKKNNTKIR